MKKNMFHLFLTVLVCFCLTTPLAADIIYTDDACPIGEIATLNLQTPPIVAGGATADVATTDESYVLSASSWCEVVGTGNSVIATDVSAFEDSACYRVTCTAKAGYGYTFAADAVVDCAPAPLKSEVRIPSYGSGQYVYITLWYQIGAVTTTTINDIVLTNAAPDPTDANYSDGDTVTPAAVTAADDDDYAVTSTFYRYFDAGSQPYMITGAKWDKRHYNYDGKVTGTLTYDAAKHYAVEAVLTPKRGHIFADDVTATINGVPAEVTIDDDGTKARLWLRYDDDDLAVKFLRVFTTDDKNWPIAGDPIPTLELFSFESLADYDTTAYDQCYAIKSVTFKADNVAVSGHFVGGKEYTVVVVVEANDGYAFASNVTGGINNTTSCDETVSGDGKTVTLTCPGSGYIFRGDYAIAPDNIFITTPTPGKTPADVAFDDNMPKAKINGAWSEVPFVNSDKVIRELGNEDTFEAGKVYRLELRVVSTDTGNYGYNFNEEFTLNAAQFRTEDGNSQTPALLITQDNSYNSYSTYRTFYLWYAVGDTTPATMETTINITQAPSVAELVAAMQTLKWGDMTEYRGDLTAALADADLDGTRLGLYGNEINGYSQSDDPPAYVILTFHMLPDCGKYFDVNGVTATYNGVPLQINANYGWIDQLRSDEARFTTYGFPIATAETTHGKVSVDKTWALAGETVTVTVTPDKGYRPVENGIRVTYNAAAGSETPDIRSLTVADGKFTLPADATPVDISQLTVTAEFEPDEDVPAVPFIVHTLFNGVGGSYSVSFHGATDDSSPVDTAMTGNGFYAVPVGEKMTLTATPAPGYTFKGWFKGNVDAKGQEDFATDELISADAVYTFFPSGFPYICPVFVAATPQPQPTPFRFDDVKDESAFYFAPVYWAVDHKPQITKGMTATLFKPNDTCTRGQVVTFLWRANGEPAPTGNSNPFKDVKAGAYYEKAVLWAVEKGITKGTSATTFGPDAPCTRGQVVTFLHRAKGEPKPAKNSNPFNDVAASQYYYQAVLWAVGEGITTGATATTFAPNSKCTRGHIVTFLYRAAK